MDNSFLLPGVEMCACWQKPLSETESLRMFPPGTNPGLSKTQFPSRFVNK